MIRRLVECAGFRPETLVGRGAGGQQHERCGHPRENGYLHTNNFNQSKDTRIFEIIVYFCENAFLYET
jgi:hypothetical protein